MIGMSLTMNNCDLVDSSIYLATYLTAFFHDLLESVLTSMYLDFGSTARTRSVHEGFAEGVRDDYLRHNEWPEQKPLQFARDGCTCACFLALHHLSHDKVDVSFQSRESQSRPHKDGARR